MTTRQQDPRSLPLLERATSDWRVIVLTILTAVGALTFFAVTHHRFPRVYKGVGWFFDAFGLLMAVGGIASLVHDIRNRRRPHPYIPPPLQVLSMLERSAAQTLTPVVLDYPTLVEVARAQGSMTAALKAHIDQSATMFFLVAGETPDTIQVFRSQLLRIVAAGDPRLLAGWRPPST
jgi:hypothetical protein